MAVNSNLYERPQSAQLKFQQQLARLQAAFRQGLEVADAGSSVRRVRRHFADAQERILTGRFGARSSASRPSEVGHLLTFDLAG